MIEITGEIVAKWREEHGLSQQELADLVPMKVGTLRDWELPSGKGNPPPMFYRVLESIALQRDGGLSAIVARAKREAVEKATRDIREQIEFELAREQAKQKPAPQWAVTGESEQFTEPRPPAEKPLAKSYAQRQREDLVARATAKGVCADCGDKLPWCSC